MAAFLPAKNQWKKKERRYAFIRACANAEPGTHEHAAVVAAAAAAVGITIRTGYRWLERFRRGGVESLANKRPANAGKQRVLVSRAFDREARRAGIDEETLREISSRIDVRIRAIWASPSQRSGINEVRKRANFELELIAEGHGLKLPEGAFTLSHRRLRRFEDARQVDVYLNDQKKFADGLPRIQRTFDEMSPMDSVTADVKPIDSRLRRPDSTVGYPKAVAFRDDAIHRIFVYLFLLPQGQAIRQEHFIEAFMAMVAHPLWGFPKSIHLDNGKEFGCAEALDEAFAEMAVQAEKQGRPIIRAHPYNASAKTIESAFSSFDLYVIKPLSGYAGADRLRKKTQRLGAEPQEFQGTWEEFQEHVGVLVEALHNRAIAKGNAGETPNTRLAQHIGKGWKPTKVDDASVDAAFCKRGATRQMDRGAISIKKRRHYHPRFDEIPHGTTLNVVFPWRRGALPMAELPDGSFVYVAPDKMFGGRDVNGARDSSRRQRRYVAWHRKMAQSVEVYDPVAASRSMNERKPAPEPPGWGPEMRINEGLALLAAARASPEPQSERDDAPNSAMRRRDTNLTELIEREDDVERFFRRR